MKKVVISGASGFVGNYLQEYFRDTYIIETITRNELDNPQALKQKLQESDVVINLAGANIMHKWSDEYKKLLVSSRINTTQNIVDVINVLETPPVLISTSAIGIYDTHKYHDESSQAYANDFLSTLCQNWEAEAQKSRGKVAIFRFGVVLGKEGGALNKMLTPFEWGVGGTIGEGKQHFSYIHIEDLARAYKFVIELSFEGIFNLTTPHPTTNSGLTKALGKALHRPTFLPVPTFVLKAIFGEGAAVLIDGQNATPARLLERGFDFTYKTIDEVVQNLV